MNRLDINNKMGVEISNLGNFYYPKNKNEDKRQVIR